MYDSHKYSKSYKRLKEAVIDIINGDSDWDRDTITDLWDEVQEQYDSGDLTSTQYDELMGYLQDIGAPYQIN